MFFIIPDGPCSKVITRQALETYRLNMSELPDENRDLIILSHMQQTRLTKESNPNTQKSDSHTQVSVRQRASVKFFLFGHAVCRTTYLFAHGIGIKRYKNLCKHFDINGVTPRIHKNTGSIPKHGVTVEEEQNAVTFIRNFAEKFAMPLPGRMPRMKDYTVMMLPSDVTKSEIWNKYVQSCTGKLH